MLPEQDTHWNLAVSIKIEPRYNRMTLFGSLHIHGLHGPSGKVLSEAPRYFRSCLNGLDNSTAGTSPHGCKLQSFATSQCCMLQSWMQASPCSMNHTMVKRAAMSRRLNLVACSNESIGLQGHFGASILLCKYCRQIGLTAAVSAGENRQTCVGWAVISRCRLCMLAQRNDTMMAGRFDDSQAPGREGCAVRNCN